MVADEHCYIVGKPRQRPGRDIEIEKPSYYTTAAQAVRGALQRAMRGEVQNGDITTLQQFLDRQEELQAEFSRKIAPLE